MTRWVPSEPALVMPVVKEGQDLGQPGLNGGGQAFEFGQAGDGAAVVEAKRPLSDDGAVRVGAGY
ncbi:hypothetical protein [Nonomuraea sp. NPDC003709]|uniref:hypothetical protein n=1 Tax=Nonomuraea sp. NPDC003709 TaxID=3154450 RepID=UPI00339E61B9